MNFSWTLAGNVVNAAGQWAILVLIARLANQEAVGKFALASALATPVFLLAGLQLRSVLATDTAGLFPFSDYFGTRVAGAAVALAGTAAVAWVAGYDRPAILVVLALALTRAIDAIADIHYGLLQLHERMRPIGQSYIARGVLSVLAMGAVLRAGGGLALALVAFAGCSLAVLFGYDMRMAAPILRASAQARSPRFDGPAIRRILPIALPLGLVNLAVSLRTYLPRFFIESRFGAAELGVFAALSSFIAAGTLVVSALGQSATPRLARQFHRGEIAAFRRLMAGLVLAGTGVGAAGIAISAVAGTAILRLVFGSEYSARSDLLVWVMVVGLLAYVSSFLGYALTAARLFTVQLPLFSATALACAAGCRWLVPVRGLVGAALAWGGSLLVEAIASAILLELALRRRAAGVAP